MRAAREQSENSDFQLDEIGVVKRAVIARESKGAAMALSAVPPVSLRIGESGTFVVKV